MGESRRPERGAAVPDFVLVLLVFIPLVLGIMQVGLIAWVHNSATGAASAGARAAAPLGATHEQGRERAQAVLAGTVAADDVSEIRVSDQLVDGVPTVAVHIEARVPALGLFGPGITVSVEGHAIKQVPQ